MNKAWRYGPAAGLIGVARDRQSRQAAEAPPATGPEVQVAHYRNVNKRFGANSGAYEEAVAAMLADGWTMQGQVTHRKMITITWTRPRDHLGL